MTSESRTEAAPEEDSVNHCAGCRTQLRDASEELSRNTRTLTGDIQCLVSAVGIRGGISWHALPGRLSELLVEVVNGLRGAGVTDEVFLRAT